MQGRVRKVVATQTICTPDSARTLCELVTTQLPGELVELTKSEGAAQLLNLAWSSGTTVVKLCPEYGTATKKFKGSSISLLQVDPSKKDEETEITFLRQKYNKGMYMITR